MLLVDMLLHAANWQAVAWCAHAWHAVAWQPLCQAVGGTKVCMRLPAAVAQHAASITSVSWALHCTVLYPPGKSGSSAKGHSICMLPVIGSYRLQWVPTHAPRCALATDLLGPTDVTALSEIVSLLYSKPIAAYLLHVSLQAIHASACTHTCHGFAISLSAGGVPGYA